MFKPQNEPKLRRLIIKRNTARRMGSRRQYNDGAVHYYGGSFKTIIHTFIVCTYIVQATKIIHILTVTVINYCMEMDTKTL